MSSQPWVPEQYEHLVDLAAEGLGGFVVYATDDYFAEKENLLHKPDPVFVADRFTDRGKWMDGWETRRQRSPAHDFVIIRLGAPGSIEGVLVDTTHFRGNAPAEIAVEGIDAPDATPERLLQDEGWHVVVARTGVKPNFRNLFEIGGTRRCTHVKLRNFPDGGIARLRVYGTVEPEPRTSWRPGSIDLAAVENGGTVVKASDRFFGPPSNLLLPGRGVNMGDGWETARRRTPGTDWCVIRLGRPGTIDRIELDTHFFKGNPPNAVHLEAIDARRMGPGDLAAYLDGKETWPELLGLTPTEHHKRHTLYPDRRVVVTHVRVHMHPHGGINRLRLFGLAEDDDQTRRRLAELNALATDDAKELFLSFNGSRRLASELAARRPFGAARELFEAEDRLWWSLDEADHREAFAAHPRIGDRNASPSQNARSAAWSSGEQAGAAGATLDVTTRLAELNEAYFGKFGFIYIVMATGRTATEMLEILEERLANERATELANAAREQARITRLRLEKWLLS